MLWQWLDPITKPQTLHRAINTWRELRTYLEAHPAITRWDIGRIAMEEFLFNAPHAPRAYMALKWLENNFSFGWPIAQITTPEAAAPTTIRVT